MSADWPRVPLGEVLTLREPDVEVAPDQQYNFAGVYCFGRGAFVGRTKVGREFAYPRLTRLRAGNFVYPKLMAWEGAYALVPRECDGLVVSTEYPVFAINTNRLIPAFLEAYFKRASIWPEFGGVSTGTNVRRRRLNPADFLSYRFPLPPPAEQRRIMARVESVAGQIAEARRLREEATAEADELYGAIRFHIYEKLAEPRTPLGKVFHLVNGRGFKPSEWGSTGRRIIRIQNLKYPDAPFNYFDGVVAPQHLVQRGDVLFAWSGQIVSLGAHIWNQEESVLNQHIFRVVSKCDVLPRFAQEGLNALVTQMKRQVRGLEMFHIRKQELNRLPFPLPTVDEQWRIVAHLDALQAKADALRTLQSETATELDALLPAVLAKAFAGQL